MPPEIISAHAVLTKLEERLSYLSDQRDAILKEISENQAAVTAIRRELGLPLQPTIGELLRRKIGKDAQDTYAGVNLLDAIKKRLVEVGHPMPLAQVAKDLQERGFRSRSEDFLGVIRTMVSRHGAEEGLVRFEDGTWGFKDMQR